MRKKSFLEGEKRIHVTINYLLTISVIITNFPITFIK